MIRFLLRFLGLVVLALAFIFLVYDGTKSIAANAFYITKVDDVWFNIHQTSQGFVEDWIKRNADWAWDPGVRTVLEQPAWLVLGVLAVLLVLLGRKKKPLIGYARD